MHALRSTLTVSIEYANRRFNRRDKQIRGRKVFESIRRSRLCAKTAGKIEVKSALFLAIHDANLRNRADIVNGDSRVILVATFKGDLEFAGKILIDRIPQEVIGNGLSFSVRPRFLDS